MNDNPSPLVPGSESGLPPSSAGLGELAQRIAGEVVEFQALDARVIHLWRLQSLISWSMLSVVVMVVGLFFLINYPEGWIWALSALGAVIVVAAFGILWIPPRAYRASGYRIDEKVLEVRKGIWFQVLTLLPLSRLQHVDLNRGPLERMFGLASLHLHTAGTEHSSVTIEGLTEADAVVLRDRLVEVGAGGDDAV